MIKNVKLYAIFQKSVELLQYVDGTIQKECTVATSVGYMGRYQGKGGGREWMWVKYERIWLYRCGRQSNHRIHYSSCKVTKDDTSEYK